MSDYISREEAVNALSRGEGCGNVCRKAIERIPVADVQPVVHGRWKTEILVGSLCSVCGKHPYPYQADSASDDYWKPSFCPNCGAKMDLEVE